MSILQGIEGEVDRKLQLVGPYEASLRAPGKHRSPQYLPARQTLERLFARATAFGIKATLFKRDRAELAPPAAELRDAIAPAIRAALWATEWPGTREKPGSLLLFGEATPLAVQELVARATSLLWKAGNFEDLMVFEGDHLSFYVCTHEEFGTISGSAELLDALGAERRDVDRSIALRLRGKALSAHEKAAFGLAT